MKILHLTDIHYSNKAGDEQTTLFEKLIEKVKQFDRIDFLIISGDLVNQGDEIDNFYQCKRELIDRLSHAANLNQESVFICPGNHDVDRNSVSEVLFQSLHDKAGKKDQEELNSFYNGGYDYDLSKEPLKKYTEFFEESYNQYTTKSTFFYSIWKQQCGGEKVYFVGLNSTWLDVSDNCNGKLAIPHKALEECLRQIPNDGLKIVFMHHPIKSFSGANMWNVEDVLYKKFDVLFTGHFHQSRYGINYPSNTGIITIESSACLSIDMHSEIGFTVLNFDLENNKYKVDQFLYNKRKEFFYYDEHDTYNEIPSSSEKLEFHRLRSKLKSKFEEEERKSKKLFLNKEIYADEEVSFDDLFSNPVLKTRSRSELNELESIVPDYLITDILKHDSSFYIVGNQKSGKTILLKYVLLHHLSNYHKTNKIPIYFDLSEYGIADDIEKLEPFIKTYFETSKKKAAEILQSEELIFLVDNLDSSSDHVISLFNDLIDKNPKIRFIICDKLQSINFHPPIEKLNISYTKLYIHELRRKQLLNHALKTLDKPRNEVIPIVEKVETIFKKIGIPFDFWSVSLFLWIFKGNLYQNLSNEVGLIDLYVEGALGKNELIKNPSKFTYNQVREYLAHLSFYIVSEYQESNYQLTYTELINFTEKYKSDKLPLPAFTEKELVQYVIDAGVISTNDNQNYFIRLKGLFEYFLGLYMTLDDDFRSTILNDKELFVSFGNEFQLYAGFKRKDKNFLEDVLKMAKIHLSFMDESYLSKSTEWDNRLRNKMQKVSGIVDFLERVTEKLSSGIDDNERDKLEEQLNNEINTNLDESKPGKKEIIQIDQSVEIVEKILGIVGGVLKNTDEIDSKEKAYDIFQEIFDLYVAWGFFIIDELQNSELNPSTHTDATDLLEFSKMLTKAIPTIVQTRIFESIGHVNFEEYLINQLDSITKESEVSEQYKLFLILFTLADLNINKHFKTIVQHIDKCDISLLKFSIILKLNYYLGFKLEDKSKLNKEMKTLLIAQNKRFDHDTEVPAIQQSSRKREQNRRLTK